MKNDFANLQKYALENKEITPICSNTIVFMGDSITEFWKSIRPSFFVENFINRGISGQTTAQMVLRFQQDVVNLKPSVVVILAGINDIAENNGPISTEKIMTNIILMSESAKKNDIKVILCSVLPANKFNWRPDILPAEKVIELNAYIKNYCLENKINYVDYYTEMVDKNKGLISDFGADGVHPNCAGYKVMEEILLNKLKSLSQLKLQ